MADQEIAFRHFYESTYPKVKPYLIKVLGPHSHLEDIAQEAYIKIWNQWEKLDHSRALEPYLFTTLRHTIISYYRKAHKMQLVALSEYTDHPTEAEPVVASLLYKEYLSIYENTLRTIQAAKQRCFRLHWHNGLTYQQIAERERISVKTVERHVNEVKALLRNRIDIHTLYVLILMAGSSA